MPIYILKGDLIELFKQGQFDVLVHGCNCYNIMGAGFAKKVKENFPEAFEADKKYYFEKGSRRLGKFSCYKYKREGKTPLTIINAYTQLNTGKNFDLEAFKECLRVINQVNPDSAFLDKKDIKIAFPGLIGCGLGGGNTEEVMNAIQEYLPDREVYIVYPH